MLVSYKYYVVFLTYLQYNHQVMVDVGRYVSSQIRQAKQNRIAFGDAEKNLAVSLDLRGRYFTPLSDNSKITVQHNRKVNIKSKTFSNSFNDATDFYGAFVRTSADAASNKIMDINGDFGRTRVPLLMDGSFVIDPLYGHSEHLKSRFGVPLEIYKKSKLKTLVSLGGT